MKNTIIKYGIISGSIAGLLLFAGTLIFKYLGYDKVGFDNVGYFGLSFILVAMSVIYFGIKSFRDLQNGGVITFGKAFLTGLGILIVSSIIYSLSWLVIYYFFIPTFMDDYASYCIIQTKNSGVTQVELSKKLEEVNQMKEWYKNPFSIFAITLLEPIPVGLLVTLISAFALKKK
jgi:hypothetical protein